jgi:DNA helicase-2/ATP-dependent DNA helicase PcrA
VNLDALLAGLDADQHTAVTTVASPLAIIAAAGSGKTTVLTRRIAFRVAADADMSAQHVLALTFTNQAASELHKRLRHAGLRERVEAGTFHAVALRLLRQRAVDTDQRPPVVASDRFRLVNEALRLIGSKADPSAVLNDLDWTRARQLRAGDAAVTAKRFGRRLTLEGPEFSALAEAYTTTKARRGVLDFDDLLERCLHALQTDRSWAAGIRWRFRHLFVDEAQDLNPLQHSFLEAIRGDRTDLCFVGDPRQAIFGFNGADPTIMTNVEQLYPGITIVRLNRNYRCTPQIINAARSVLQRANQTDDSVAVPTDGEQVRVIAEADEAAENAAIPRLLREIVGAHQLWRSCAVLARTGVQLTAVNAALTRAGIPANVQGRTGARRAFGSALGEAYACRTHADLGAWVERVTSDPDADRVRARVAEAADRFIAQRSGMSFRSWVDLHSPFDDLDVAETDDAVDLLTFHGAKGREWQTVIIIGAEQGLIPHSTATTPAQRDEEARLLYVACTRARSQLIITRAVQRNDRNTQPSVFIADVGAATDDAYAGPPVLRPARQPRDPVYAALVTWRSKAAKAAQVDPAAICSDQSLRALAEARPTTVDEVIALTDLGPVSAARIAPRLLETISVAAQPTR